MLIFSCSIIANAQRAFLNTVTSSAGLVYEMLNHCEKFGSLTLNRSSHRGAVVTTLSVKTSRVYRPFCIDGKSIEVTGIPRGAMTNSNLARTGPLLTTVTSSARLLYEILNHREKFGC